MFTGIVQTTGGIRSRSGPKLVLEAVFGDGDLELGESIAVDGVCLTVTCIEDRGFHVDVSPETLRKTTLQNRVSGSRVNLERALTLRDRLGGHLVMGHVDATIPLIWRRPQGGAERWRFGLPSEFSPFVATKGSVTLDGVSLTVASRGADHFEVALIPHTLSVTTLGTRRTGESMNFEVDILARYAEQILKDR